MAETERGPLESTKGQTKKGDTAAFLAKVVKLFARVESAEAPNRQEAVDDIKFRAGQQWPEALRASRTLDKRPCLTINKMNTFVHQITNDQRQNRPAINVSPVGDRSDPEVAKMLRGLIRQIERQSNADVAYDTAFESAVTMGWGYWRLLTEYEEDGTFDQIVKVCRIRNPFRVYIDPDCQEPDGSDAQYFFVSDMLPREEFEDLYPHIDLIAWEEGGLGDEYKLWSTGSHVRIAEYWCYEIENRTLVKLKTGHVGFKDKLDPSLQNVEVLEEREVRQKKVKWYKLTAHDILEQGEWPGAYLPIVRVLGNELDVEGKTKLSGIVRDAKDPQRMYNFWVTSETELIALAPKAPWVMEEGQIEGHEKSWRDANNKAMSYLLYRGTNVGGKPAPPPQRQQFAGPPAAVVQAKIGAAQDMQAVIGIRFDATLQERMYDESGSALRELKRVSDIGSFHYIDNHARALKWGGKLLIDLIPKVYDTRRIVTILREDDSEETIQIDPTMGQAMAKHQLPDGNIRRLFNPRLGRYDVAVTIGPSYATKRAEAADSMLGFMKAVPQAAPIIGDLIAKNMDWPGAEEIATRLATMLPPQLQGKNMQDLPPQARALVMSLQQQLEQMKQQRDQAAIMLADQEKDRQLEREGLDNERKKIAADFEAKVAKIVVDFETKMAAIAAKSSDADHTHKQIIAMEKIAADFEAKMVKIAADLELGRMKNEMQYDMRSIQM